MILAALLIAQGLIELHGPADHIIYVNPHEVTSLREPIAVHRHHFSKGTRCIVVMGNGNLIAVKDTCAEVRSLVDAHLQ